MVLIPARTTTSVMAANMIGEMGIVIVPDRASGNNAALTTLAISRLLNLLTTI